MQHDSERYLYFRFDVDTYLCTAKGIPNLLALARESEVSFTFFFNMGRSISRTSCLKNRVRKSQAPSGAKLSNLDKLGVTGYLITAALNPFVGKSYPDVVKATAAEGHEVGLHGGSNHGTWMVEARHWSSAKIKREVDWGLAELRKAGVDNVRSFSSPGWQGSPALHEVLAEFDINVVADLHGSHAEDIRRINGKLYDIPTNLTGEPGGIGYLEHKRAQGLSDGAIMASFRDEIERTKAFSVLYDHPYYCGIRELDLLRNMIDSARDMGFKLVTMSQLPALLNVA